MRAIVAAVLAFVPGGLLSAADLPCPAGWAPHASGVVSPRADELGLDETIRSALEAVPVTPGLAIGILYEGEVVYARGFGVRDLDTCAPVTPESVFYLLSVTKSFTGLAAALLHEEGALELDQSLDTYFPDASITPPIRLAQTSLRDLLNHRPGFWNGAINFRSFLPGNLDNEAMLYVLEHHSRPYRLTYQYANMGYVIAGAAIEMATGLHWRELLESKIFEPLEMTASTTSIDKAVAGPFAYPYGLSLDSEFEPAMVKVQPQMHAAGGATSTVTDLLRWVEANLEGGVVDGERVLPALVVRQAQAPQIQYEWIYGPYRRFAYGLGVHNSELNGELVIHHFGGPIHVSFAPDRRLGVVMLSAATYSAPLVHRLAASLYDLWLGKDGASETLADHFDAARESIAKSLERRRERHAGYEARRGELVRPASDYAGTYRSDRLGEMIVTGGEAGVNVRFGVMSLDLVALEADVFLARFPDGDQVEFKFEPWKDGRPMTLDWEGRVFQRVP